MEEQTTIDEIYGGDAMLMKAEDIKEPVPAIIESIEVREFISKEGPKKKLVITLKGFTKKLVCNKTNANRIAATYGKDYSKWTGKKIQIYTILTAFRDQEVPAIRVKVD